jgi:signal transduction histidine kinase
MNTKSDNNLNRTISANKIVRHINGSSKLTNASFSISDKLHENDKLLASSQKLEEINGYLEKLVESERKKVNELIETNNRFLRIVAHDLRNPFSTTLSILDLLNESLEDYSKAEIQELLKAANNSAIKAQNLLESLLAWSMSQSLEKKFNPVKVNLRELVINEIERFNNAAILKRIDMDQSIDPNLHVSADFEMVKTIFRNLISNAIKYTRTGGEIFISANGGNKQFVKIEVRDNGIGMSQKTKEKLFKIDEFNSISGTNNEQGSGLGLLFCKEFIDLHGGTMSIESEPGKGSIFKFTLPQTEKS